MKHLSHYVKSDARMLQVQGTYDDILAFQNPDESIVLVVYSEEERELKIKIGTELISPKLKAGSFNTLLISH